MDDSERGERKKVGWDFVVIIKLMSVCMHVLQYVSGWLLERNKEQWGNRDKVY